MEKIVTAVVTHVRKIQLESATSCENLGEWAEGKTDQNPTNQAKPNSAEGMHPAFVA